ncbi:MAG: glycoside hydrolase family 38 C-terminal domain-containing protein [Candidatus Neomarinimicrobiota bacterium]
MNQKKTIHILSNTHWDREWRFPFQETRLHLVKLLDNLLNLMETDPEYKYFNFDSQTIFLDDYLEIKPENRSRLEALIKAGRLIVGPWYTLPEEFTVNAESLVRNLLMGKRVGDSFGKTSKVGYTPTSYGQISQMAQIYDGFGIDGIIFYRGIHHTEGTNEYFLEAPDGTRILGIRLSRHVSRGAFFMYVSKRTMHDPEWHGFRWGEEGCLPFHFCRADHDHEEEPLIIRSPYGETCKLENVKPGILTAMEDILEQATTDCLVLFDGMDSAYPNKHLPQIIAAANKVNHDWKFIHSSLPNFLADLKPRIEPEKLTVLKGERRHPSPDNMFNAFLKDSLSSRIYIKQRNAEVERTLMQWAEPFSVIAELLDEEEYPASVLIHAWKILLSCHSHDGIGGLSPDQIHKDMLSRFDQVELIGQALMKTALGGIVSRIDTGNANPEDVMITVFNPLPIERDDVPQVYIDFPREKPYRAFSIYDDQGQKVSHQAISREESYLIPIEPHELPTSYYTTKWKVAFEAKNLPALGFKTFTVKPENGRKSNYGSLVTATNMLENEFLKVKIETNGTLTVTDKKSGEMYHDLLWFEDTGESGDPWSRIPPVGDGNTVYNSLGCSAAIKQVCDGPLTTTFQIKIKMNLPAEIIRGAKKRSPYEKELPISARITLQKGDPKLHIKIDLENTVKDHRLRAMFDSGFRPQKSISSGQFDVLERDAFLPDTSEWLEPYTGTQPNNGGVWVENGKRGLAVFNFGLPEYEVFDNESGTIAMTLLRGFGYPKMSGIAREDLVERVGNEGSQCSGNQHYELALYFYSGNWQSAGVQRREREHKYPMLSVHHGRYSGQGLTKCESFLKIEPEMLIMTTLKKAESGNGYVVRFYNPSDEAAEGFLSFKFPVKRAVLLDLNEEPVAEVKVTDPHRIKVQVPQKKIITVLLKNV